MSLLWVQGAWYDARPDTDEWDEFGFGHEGREERRQRYIRRVRDLHGVDHEAALHAITRVARSLHSGEALTPIKVGFASEPSREEMVRMPMGLDHREITSHDLWSKAKIHDVDIGSHPIHASQDFIRARDLAHNLFHPGKLPVSDTEYAGHPDADPDEHRDEMDEAYYRGSGDAIPRGLPCMIRQTDGSYVVLDGHHRVATDRLLGKGTTRAHVLGVRTLRHRGRLL